MFFLDRPYLAFTILSDSYYQNIEDYTPTTEYIIHVRGACPTDHWQIWTKGFWAYATPDNYRPIESGWKIHVSSTLENAMDTLNVVIPTLVLHNTAFKFCADRRMHSLSLNKNWSRAQAGKFITIYPDNEEIFVKILSELNNKTRHLRGPYVLTDAPYSGSKILYYRYGEHAGTSSTDCYGHQLRGFRINGLWMEDKRDIAQIAPAEIKNPLEILDRLEAPSEDGVPLHGRYTINGAFKYSALGGVYFGHDQITGSEIVAREARYGIALDADGERDGSALSIHREAKILHKLMGTGYVPRYLDLFEEEGHWFLIEERLRAETLWAVAIRFYYDGTTQTASESFGMFVDTFMKIGAGLIAIHEKNVLIRDLTKSNVMVGKDGSVKFIDLEFAYDLDAGGPWLQGWTPGYAAEEQILNMRPTFSDDFYAFGVLMLDCLTLCASGLELNRSGVFLKLDQNLADYGYPGELKEIIRGLLNPVAELRLTISAALSLLESLAPPLSDSPMKHLGAGIVEVAPPTSTLVDEIEHTLEGLTYYIRGSFKPERRDNLWPASAEVFTTHPASLEYGASGPALFLARCKGHVDRRIVDWIYGKALTVEMCPGLMAGASGMAITLLVAGYDGMACDLIDRSVDSALLYKQCGLYYGCAGWGLANLHLWLSSQDEKYINQALDVGKFLSYKANLTDVGAYWESDGTTYLGLAEGQSGIAIFLLFLGLAVGDRKFLTLACQAVDFDISHKVQIAGHDLWRPTAGALETEPNSPHAFFGSAGVGAAAIRCYAATGELRYLAASERCAKSACVRFSNKLWQHHGISGAGELLLDMFMFTKDRRYLNLAFWLAEGILPHRIYKAGGICFAGLDFYRICCDFGLGSSGIGIFLDRVSARKSRALLLDSLFDLSHMPDESIRTDAFRKM